MNTRKKIKVLGTTKFIDNNGEVQEAKVVDIQERDCNFHKIWLEHMIRSLDLIGNQKTRLAFWIIDHLTKDNLLIMTYRQIAQKSGISLETIQTTMKALMESNFLERVNQGCYRINPDIVFKGGKSDRLNILYQYSAIKDEEIIDEDENNKIQINEKEENDVSASLSKCC